MMLAVVVGLLVMGLAMVPGMMAVTQAARTLDLGGRLETARAVGYSTAGDYEDALAVSRRLVGFLALSTVMLAVAGLVTCTTGVGVWIAKRKEIAEGQSAPAVL